MTVLEKDPSAREELAVRIERAEQELVAIHRLLQSVAVGSGSTQMYVEAQMARATELVHGCVRRLRRG